MQVFFDSVTAVWEDNKFTSLLHHLDARKGFRLRKPLKMK